MKNLKKLTIFALVLALIAGCSSKPAPSAASAGSDSEVKSKVVIATDTDLASMDQNIATDGTSFIAQTLVFAGLVEVDENNKPIPDMAERWEISEDGTVYTFYLSADAKWSNGAPVTAQDFVFGWQRQIAEETASEYAFILSTIKLKNAAAVGSGELPPEELGIKALDDKTVQVTLDDPVDFMLALLAFPCFFPLNQEFYEAQGDQYALSPANMLFNGPYVMTSWTPGNSYSFKKNPDYVKADQIYVEEIDYKFIQDTQSAMLEYQSGNLDIVKLSGEMVDAYEGQEGFENRLQGFLWYLSLNFEVPAIANDDLRQALQYAVDRETIAESVLKDGSIAAEGIIPIELAVGPDGKEYRESAGKLVEYDPVKANEYYEKAKAALGGDVSLELLFEDTEASKAVAEYIQSNLETNLPGLKVTLNSKPKKTRLQMMQNGEYQIALHRWGPDYSDPQTYLDLFLIGASYNNGKYVSQAYQDLVIEATQGDSAKDSVARWNLLLQAEKLLIKDDAAVVPVYQNGGAMMIRSNVSGVEFHSAGVDNYRRLKVK